ncbi:MAG: hypothetical protein LPK00_00685 [Bacillaceae bacterium]|nr:hypothetical protein [Bacillaceae bacterium]
MIVGRLLYILGFVFVFISIIFLIMSFINSENIIIPIFAILNGLIAMGVGDLVINMNHKKA